MKRFIIGLAMLIFFSGFLLSQEVETVRLGSQIWMKRNLNVVMDSSVCFKHKEQHCEIFGRLYNWETALKACPQGFRLPTDDDWSQLIEYMGGLNLAGYKLLVGGESGFDVLLGGNYNAELDIFSYQYRQAYFWTATPFSETAAWMRHFINEKTNVNRSTVKKHYFFSVRCIKN